MTTAVLIALGAAIGAPLRFLADRAVRRRVDSVFPWGTFAVNVAGSGLLGLLAGLPASGHLMALAGVGFCGALATYSTFGYETLRLIEDRAHLVAALNTAASITAGLAAAYAGLLIAHAAT